MSILLETWQACNYFSQYSTMKNDAISFLRLSHETPYSFYHLHRNPDSWSHESPCKTNYPKTTILEGPHMGAPADSQCSHAQPSRMCTSPMRPLQLVEMRVWRTFTRGLRCSQSLTIWISVDKSLKSESVSLSGVSDSAMSWTVACQAPLFMEISRQAYWSG